MIGYFLLDTENATVNFMDYVLKKGAIFKRLSRSEAVIKVFTLDQKTFVSEGLSRLDVVFKYSPVATPKKQKIGTRYDLENARRALAYNNLTLDILRKQPIKPTADCVYAHAQAHA